MIAVGIALAGCCATPAAAKYFDRGAPFDTVQGFAYAVRTGQWRFAYDCLTPRTKQLYTYTMFRIVLQFNRKGIRDIIEAAERNRFRARLESGRLAKVPVRYTDAQDTTYDVDLYLEREGREWLIDLDRTLQENAGLKGAA